MRLTELLPKTMNEMPVYYFKIVIGDYTQDGHGMSSDYLIQSNKPACDVRSTHESVGEKLNIYIEDICDVYEMDEIDEDTVTDLENLGYEFEDASGMGKGIVSPDEMARIWLFLLMKADPELKLEIIENDLDELNRNIADSKCYGINIGYGLFH